MSSDELYVLRAAPLTDVANADADATWTIDPDTPDTPDTGDLTAAG